MPTMDSSASSSLLSSSTKSTLKIESLRSFHACRREFCSSNPIQLLLLGFFINFQSPVQMLWNLYYKHQPIMLGELICDYCGLIFESDKALNSHKTKFCQNSKYGNLEQLEQQFQEASKGRDLSIYGQMSLAQKDYDYDFTKQKPVKQENVDHEYKKVLKQIGEKQAEKTKLDREKEQAFKELNTLDRQENELVIEAKQEELGRVINRRNQLATEEEMIEKELKDFQIKKMEFEKSIVKQDEDDFLFKEGRKAGKLVMQRKMYEDEMREYEYKLRQNKRKQEKLKEELGRSRVVDPPEKKEKMNKSSVPNKSSAPVFHVPEEPKISKLTTHNRSLIDSIQNSRARSQRNPPSEKHPVDVTYRPLQAANFYQKEPFLAQMVNPKGKSQQDVFIESLIAQEYDTLNLLAKLPKESQIYKVKLKQYQEMATVRNQILEKVQNKRVQKMKRYFQFEKQLDIKERENAVWKDENWKAMMDEQVDAVKDYMNQDARRIIEDRARQRQQYQYDQYPQQQPYQQQPYEQQPYQQQPPYQQPPQYQQYEQPQSQKNPYLKKQISSRKDANERSQTKLTGQNIPKYPTVNEQLPSYKSQLKQSQAGLQHPSLKFPSEEGIARNPKLEPLYRNEEVNLKTMEKANESSDKFGPRYSEKKQTKDPFEGMYGYKIIVHYLKNYQRGKPIKLKLILKENDSLSSEGIKYEFNTSYHDERAKSEKDPYNPNFKNKIDHSGSIMYNESFIVPINLQSLYHQFQREIYLHIIASEKDVTKMTNQPSTYSWYCFKVTHFGQLREGTFTLNLYSDEITYPEPADMNKLRNKLQEEVRIELSEIIMDRKPSYVEPPAPPPKKPSVVSVPPPRQETIESIPSSHQSSRKSTPPVVISKESLQPSQEEEIIYHKNELPTQFLPVSKGEPLNFDFSIAAFRTLPSFIGPIKIQITYIDVDKRESYPREEVLAEIGSDMCNPYINYTKQFRGPNKLTSSTIAFIRILTYSILDYEVYMLGFSVIYFFFDEEGIPLNKNGEKEYLLNTGLYQAPIFWQVHAPELNNLETFSQNIPLIPGASILYGITANDSQISNPLPKYSSREYNTVLFHLNDLQLRLLEQQYKRERVDTNQHVNGYLQHKGIKKGLGSEEIRKYLQKSLYFKKDNAYQLFNLDAMAEYEPYFGIYVSIDKLVVPFSKQRYMYFCTLCVAPPAKYYRGEDVDLEFVHKFDIDNSTETEVLFKERQVHFQPKFNINASLIIEINRVKVDDGHAVPLIQSISHLTVPLFYDQPPVSCVNVLSDTIPMIDGQFEVKSVDKIQESLSKFLKTQNHKKKSKIKLGIRIFNGFFINQHPVIQLDPKGKPYMKYPEFKSVKKEVTQLMKQHYSVDSL